METRDHDVNHEIATKILTQLGGNRFRRMTGAWGLIAINHGLQLYIPRSNNIRRVQIVLNGEDCYTMAFYSMNSRNGVPNPKLLKSVHGVSCNQLQSVFTATTGLYTTL